MLLEGKVAVVTGGARGIGLGIAQRFAEEGVKVIITDIQEDMGMRATEELQNRGFEVVFSRMDVTDEENISRTLSMCLDLFGQVDILVNNAGIVVDGDVVNLDLQEWKRVLAVNLTGSFLCSQQFCRQMIKQGSGGNVIFISSQAGKRGASGCSAYCASKFGVLGIMECLALEVAPYDIRVNAVCPGNVETPMIQYVFDSEAQQKGMTPGEIRQHYVNRNPLGRLATPAEVGDVCVFLCSSMASYITGESINVDGGELSG